MKKPRLSGGGQTQGQGGGAGKRIGAGPGGECVCPKCGTRTPHKAGVPCYTVDCPACGQKMTRA